MELVLITALGVGGATIVGALLGFIFKNPSHRMSDMLLSFAAGVMLAAAVIGLVLPSVEYGGGGWLARQVVQAVVPCGRREVDGGGIAADGIGEGHRQLGDYTI